MTERNVDEKYMQLALELAEKGRGRVEPNPMVGAVLVKAGKIIAQGYHQAYGGPHAEIHAISEGGIECKGATLYVTMEPCAHFGKTAPCADAIIRAGISRVVAAVIDPNPVTSGEGIRRLKDAGIEVVLGIMEEQARRLNAPFFKLIQKGIPYVIIKWAMSLDGKIATRTGDSRWITSEASREYVHTIRGMMDGIMVGIGTVIQDDPLLTCRINGRRKPKRIVVDSDASLPADSRLLKTVQEGEIIVAVREGVSPDRIRRLEQAGCTVIHTNASNGQIDLMELFQKLGKMQLTNILVEGGSRIIASVIEDRLVDRFIVFVAPIIIGGEGAKSPVGGKGIEKLCDALKVRELEVRKLSDDIVLEGIVTD